MRDIDLKTLRLYAAVCEQRSIARAAAEAHIEPSAISKRIAQLEADLGVALLLRERRGVQPTPAGAALLEHARSMLFTLERIAGDMAAFGSGVKGHVRIVASASAIAESLLDDVASFMRLPANRNVKVDIEERLSREVGRELREGSASLGVCATGQALEGLETRDYRRDRLVLAVHPEHPLAARRSLRFAQTIAYEHVGLPPSTAVHTMLQRAAAQAGGTLAYRAVVSNFDAAFRVVAANLGVSVVPDRVGADYAALHGIRLIALDDAWARRQFKVAFRAHAALQPAAQRMVEHLQARAAAEDGVRAAPSSSPPAAPSRAPGRRRR